MVVRVLVLVTALTLHLALLTAARNYDVILERIDGYEANPEYIGEDSFMRIRRADKASLPGLYHTLNIIKALPNNTEVEAVIYEWHDNKQIPSWLKYKSNFCEYIANEKKPIINELGKVYKFTKCPVVGLFKFENWHPDDRLMPPVLPGPDRMNLALRFTTGSTLIAKWGVVFSVDRSKGSALAWVASRRAAASTDTSTVVGSLCRTPKDKEIKHSSSSKLPSPCTLNGQAKFSVRRTTD